MKILMLLFTSTMLTAGVATAFEAGAAKVDITAPVGAPLNGYGARMGRDSTDVHDPIWSRALFLDDGATRVFLVSVDLVAINPELRNRVLELMPDIVPPENIILTATHTHSGQGAMVRSIPFRFVSGRFIPDVLESTAHGMVESMVNAYDKRRRAALGYAVGRHEGLSVNRRDAGGPTDPQLGVILVEDSDGNPISIVTNFTGHPTSVGGDDLYSFSADYPGFYYLEMEALLGQECVPLFLNGALGNQTVANPENKSGWDRTESIGRLLARQAFNIAESLAFGAVTLRISHNQARLPRTLGDVFLPETVWLQSLEIDDLLMSFFPGEPCVELGLEMRGRALERGYDAHFSVGLSNDYIMYFVPRHLYPDLTYESSANHFGPGIEDWFYAQFEGLMSKQPPAAAEPAEPVDALISSEEIAGALLIDLAGPPHAVGIARGNLMVADIQQQFESRVVIPVDTGVWLPDEGILTLMPGFMNTTALALPLMGTASRPLLQGLSMELIQEMEGMAEGARLPFDGLFLLQHAPLYDAIEDKASLYAAPICTMFAAVGARAGADMLVVGRNLDWEHGETSVVTRMRPDAGHAFVQAGFSWNAGVFTAMNDAGLFLSVERVHQQYKRPEKATVEFVLRDVIQQCGSFSDALERIQKHSYLEGVHVLVAGFDGDTPHAAVVEFDKELRVRRQADGLLLGVLPDHPTAPASTRARYARLAMLLEDTRLIAQTDAERVLTNTDGGAENGLTALWNRQTRHSVVAMPRERVLHLAFPTPNEAPGAYTAITMAGGEGHE